MIKSFTVAIGALIVAASANAQLYQPYQYPAQTVHNPNQPTYDQDTNQPIWQDRSGRQINTVPKWSR